MINLEQVKLLESKVVKTLEYVERLAAENTTLRQQETDLQTRLESYQKRIDELEVLVVRFKEDQSEIEEGILSALDRLSKFEKAFEKAVTKKGIHAAASKVIAKPAAEPPPAVSENTCFEIPESSAEDDIADPLVPAAEGGELDIF
ncbi:MAG: cell division protein ZapB [Treponema sp.]|nr:cell division protein ZapB [Treponema sp.]